MKKKILFPFLGLFVFCCSVYAGVSLKDAEMSLSGALDGLVSVVASTLSEPQIPLQGVTAEISQEGLPLRVSFTRSDLSSFRGSLAFSSEQKKPWYETLLVKGEKILTPIREKAVTYLESSGWEPGDMVIDGSIVVMEEEVQNPERFVLSADWSGTVIPIWISLLFTGKSLSEPVLIEGRVVIRGLRDADLTIGSEELRMNGEEITFEPFLISY